MNKWTRSKSDTTYQPFWGDTPRNSTREQQGHPNGESGTGWSTRWYGWVSTGCLNKFSSTGDATRLWAGPITAPGARSAKQAFPRTEPSWLNRWTGQWGMKERLGAQHVLESHPRDLIGGETSRGDEVDERKLSGVHFNYFSDSIRF